MSKGRTLRKTVIRDTDGGSIEVMPSSAVAVVGDDEVDGVDGPFFWVTIHMKDGREAFVHLSEDAGRRLHAAISKTMRKGAL